MNENSDPGLGNYLPRMRRTSTLSRGATLASRWLD